MIEQIRFPAKTYVIFKYLFKAGVLQQAFSVGSNWRIFEIIYGMNAISEIKRKSLKTKKFFERKKTEGMKTTKNRSSTYGK